MRVSHRAPFDPSPLAAKTVIGEEAVLVRSPIPGCAVIDTFAGLIKKLGSNCRQGKVEAVVAVPTGDGGTTGEVYPIEVQIQPAMGDQFLLVDLIQGGQRVGSARSIRRREWAVIHGSAQQGVMGRNRTVLIPHESTMLPTVRTASEFGTRSIMIGTSRYSESSTAMHHSR